MLLDHYNTTFYQRLVGSNKSFHFRGQQLGIMQAAEPSDIIWDNAGLSAKNLFFRRFTSLLIIGLLLVGCTYLIFMISEEKTDRMQRLLDQAYESGNPKANNMTISIISSIASAATVMANYFLKFFITQLVDFCKYPTETERVRIYTGALSWSQFLNTSLILSMIAEYFHNYWGLGGLATTAFEVQFIAVFVAIGLGVFDHQYWLKVWKMRQIERLGQNGEAVWISQDEVHSAYEYPKFDFASKYSLYIKDLLTAAYFAAFIPLGIPISIVLFGAGYWIDKFTLLRRTARGTSYGSELPILLTDFWDWAVIFFAIGNWQFHRYTDVGPSNITYAGIIIAVLGIIIPFDKIYARFNPIAEEKVTEDLYSKARTSFVEDYDRFNPAFKEDAIARFTYVREHGLVKKKTTTLKSTEDDQKNKSHSKHKSNKSENPEEESKEEGKDDGLKHQKSQKHKSHGEKEGRHHHHREDSASKASVSLQDQPTTLLSPTSNINQLLSPKDSTRDDKL